MRHMSQLRRLSHVCLPAGRRRGLTFAFALAALSGCASLRPKLEVARDDFATACRNLTATLAGDAHPDQVEVIVQKVCLAEQMVDRISRELATDEGELLAPFPDAGAQK